MSAYKHGQIIGHARWCNGCSRFHGVYFRCRHYTQSIIANIVDGENRLCNQLADTNSNISPLIRGIYSFLGATDG